MNVEGDLRRILCCSNTVMHSYRLRISFLTDWIFSGLTPLNHYSTFWYKLSFVIFTSQGTLSKQYTLIPHYETVKNQQVVNMNYEDAKRVINAVAKHGKSGCGIIFLGNENNIPQSILRDFLSKHLDFFCKINSESRYAINSFGKYKGSVDNMLRVLRKKQSKSKIWGYHTVALVAFLFGYLIAGI